MTTKRSAVEILPDDPHADLRAHARTLFVGPDAVYPEDVQRHALNMVQRIILDEFVGERTRICPSCDWPEVIRRLEELCLAALGPDDPLAAAEAEWDRINAEDDARHQRLLDEDANAWQWMVD